MAARKKPQVRKNPKPRNPKTTALGPLAQQGKGLLGTSFGKVPSTSSAFTGSSGVLDYYNSLPKKQRTAAYKQLTATVKARQTGGGQHAGLTGILFEDLPQNVQNAYMNARYGGGSGGARTNEAAGGPAAFASGVSGSSLEFIKELGQSKFAEGESEAGKAGPTKKKRKAQRKKLVKRAAKKTGAPAKKIRKALRSEGISKQEKTLYARAPTNRLSKRLRMADRRNDRKK